MAGTDNHHRFVPQGDGPAVSTTLTDELIAALIAMRTASARYEDDDDLDAAKAKADAALARTEREKTIASHLQGLLTSAYHALRSYQHGNASPDLAKGVADAIDIARAKLKTAAITDEDSDDINEALSDAVCDGEGRLYAADIKHHLAKRGFVIVKAETRQQPVPEETPIGALRWLYDYIAGGVDSENTEAVAALNAEPAIANARKVLGLDRVERS